MPSCLPVTVYAGAEPLPRVFAHRSTSARTPALVRPHALRRAGLRLTERDRAVVDALDRYRALTAAQIAALFFGRKETAQGGSVSSRCQYRLKLLFQHGYVWRDAPPAKPSEGRRPLVYCLDRRGVAWLTQTNPERVQKTRWRGRHNLVSWPFLAHLLATNEVRVAVELAARQQGIGLDAWQDERRLRSTLVGQPGFAPKAALIPDGYFRLVDRGFRYHQFLEVDRATETVGYAEDRSRHKTFARKIQAYLAYYGSGQYAKHYGTRALRVLTVTTSPTRLRHLKAVTARVGGGSQFWFATLQQISQASVLTQPIWEVAGTEGRYPLLWPADRDFASNGLGPNGGLSHP